MSEYMVVPLFGSPAFGEGYVGGGDDVVLVSTAGEVSNPSLMADVHGWGVI